MEFLELENLESSLEACFFVNSFPQTFMMQYFFLEVSVNKNTSAWHLLYKQWLCKCYRFYEDYLKLDTRQKVQKDKKLVFQKNR